MIAFKIEVGDNEYLVNGVKSPRIYMKVGVTYQFDVNTKGHPFYITTDAMGGTNFQRGGITEPTEKGSFEFTPTSDMIEMKLYYQSDYYQMMGYKLHVSA